MKIPVSIRLDDNGLLRKECPFCEREFKVFYNEHTEETQSKCYCPHCGLPAPSAEQLTRDQGQHIVDLAKNEFINLVNKEFGRMKQRVKSPYIKVDFKPLEKTDPRIQIELNDMEEIITSCCNEPIFLNSPLTWKVIYCHKCGDINFPV
ncbi:hypothetical protein [Pseudobacillus wudalianchiensis]|uniref:Uncharacterized protein n=1 Tax=Pseudobacillus wudalianchiensis TaxID=1743143 RepID=A0A1B9AU76_9BACI|nr:hypothetical protein [Bacillus wudalianchiensis]OCA87331.1 hypothetical protein A8F95_08795 [Bacillus wudalianchiensis]